MPDFANSGLIPSFPTPTRKQGVFGFCGTSANRRMDGHDFVSSDQAPLRNSLRQVLATSRRVLGTGFGSPERRSERSFASLDKTGESPWLCGGNVPDRSPAFRTKKRPRRTFIESTGESCNAENVSGLASFRSQSGLGVGSYTAGSGSRCPGFGAGQPRGVPCQTVASIADQKTPWQCTKSPDRPGFQRRRFQSRPVAAWPCWLCRAWRSGESAAAVAATGNKRVKGFEPSTISLGS